MLESLIAAPGLTLLVLLSGAVVGGLIAFVALPGPRQVKRLEAELDELRKEHEGYKGNVTQHFHRTAELVGEMTASYKAVYDHLATGAQALCEGPPALSSSGFGEPRLITEGSVKVGEQDDAPAAEAETSQDAAEKDRQTWSMGESGPAKTTEDSAPADGNGDQPEVNGSAANTRQSAP